MAGATEIRANWAYNNGELGHYVINSQTDLAVAGPFRTEYAAVREAQRRNAEYPDDPNRLTTVEIVVSR